MSFEYWNAPEPIGKTFNDQLIYDQRYYNWTETPKYSINQQFPTTSNGYPKIRDNLSLRRASDVYKYNELKPNGAAKAFKKFNYNDDSSLNYMRHVYPPSYYEMWS